MLNPQMRRVRKVHLTAHSEDLIRRGALLLEDALHTASLPESRHLLIVKSFNVGTIRPDLSPAALALTIERRLRDVVPVHANDPAAHLRQAVYFRDDAEPSVMLALRLARRESTSAWFWRLAVPAWKPEMPLDDALRTIFFNVTRTKAGLAAAIRLVRELEEQHALDPLLMAIRPQDESGLMRAFGWSKPPEIPLNTSIKIPARWQSVLARWIPRWGQDDARILWLAGIALAADNPIRLLDSDLMRRAAQMVEGIANVEVGAHSPPGISVGHHASTLFETADVGATQRLAPTETSNAKGVETWRAMPLDMPPLQPRVDIADERKFETPEDKSSATVEISPVEAHHAASTMSDAEIAAEPDFAPAPWPEMPLKTLHAGLFFLIPVLARLGIAEFLTPELIEMEFPFHLLRFIGQRLNLPDDDPINAVMATDTAYDPQTHFVAPQSWRHGIANPGEPILRHMGDKNVLFDSSGRLVLAMWEGEIHPHPLIPFPLRREGGVKDANTPLHVWVRGEDTKNERTTHDPLRHAWLTAARRWLRRNTHMGLADLVLRPGHITATRTHIDVFFELAQADICVRRPGLDIDPGWVAWLGRVVHFHYVEEDQ